ncbi:SCO family protein [Galbibacter sp. EGI 63066]|uniref:SCO family protein n=1 Tax=Galbibacter sp. EGI 63066 TaxID=2993559 RepID=UPI0022489994|nr:SCO family protein [Galbibacter sp. EGI 63066]MCX2678884.1 SCO family protein [Galbibacter sp. EGI 63066]
MLRFFSKFKYLFITLFVLSVIIISLIYQVLKPKERLTVYEPAMVNPELVDNSIQYVRKYHTISPFELVNQNGDTITESNYEDKIYVADFFFTTCLSICPIMTDNMVRLQEKLKDDQEVMFLSHSVTPEIDSVPRLKEYALEKGVIDSKWNMVTGDKKQIYELARKSYMAVKTIGDGGPFDMIHTENFILVDKKKRIRGFYDGTKEEDMEKLLHDIQVLKTEYQ